MGLDLSLYAELRFTATDNNGQTIERYVQERFDVYPIGTNQIRSLIQAEDKVAAYKKFVKADEYLYYEEQVRVYRSKEEEWYPENYPDPIFETENRGEKHLQNLDAWLEEYKYWNISWSTW